MLFLLRKRTSERAFCLRNLGVSSTNFLKWFLVPKTNSHTGRTIFCFLFTITTTLLTLEWGHYSNWQGTWKLYRSRNWRVSLSGEKCNLSSQISWKYSNYSFIQFGSLFEYLFMFWLQRHLPAKQALNSKLSAKGYERKIREIYSLDRATLAKILWNSIVYR